MTAADGLVLPELMIDVTPTLVISTAIATRDFQDVHHDRDRAVARGSKDIFINILTTTGLVQRYVTDWAGPQAIVRQIAIRLGVPCYAGDTLTFTGQVTTGDSGEPASDRRPLAEPAGESGQDFVVQVVGRCSLGDHVTGTVRVSAPASAA
jgi:acyl dehydratase